MSTKSHVAPIRPANTWLNLRICLKQSLSSYAPPSAALVTSSQNVPTSFHESPTSPSREQSGPEKKIVPESSREARPHPAGASLWKTLIDLSEEAALSTAHGPEHCGATSW